MDAVDVAEVDAGGQAGGVWKGGVLATGPGLLCGFMWLFPRGTFLYVFLFFIC